MSPVRRIAEMLSSLVSRGEGHLHLTCAYYRPGPGFPELPVNLWGFLAVEMQMISAWVRRRLQSAVISPWDGGDGGR